MNHLHGRSTVPWVYVSTEGAEAIRTASILPTDGIGNHPGNVDSVPPVCLPVCYHTGMQEERQMVSKLQADFNAADKVLEATYKRLYHETTDGQVRTALVKSQQAWRALRGANAVMRANYARINAPLHDGGLASTIAMYTMQSEMTKARIKELDDIRTERNATKNQ
ncbi:MAG: DUF1311 domain-containing protein [Cytophagaceae bacterium]|nr:MAG: DUF1311 domain-containing protein [Cytophagaceae bacterium]